MTPAPEEILFDKRGSSQWVSFPKGSCLEEDHKNASTGILRCVDSGQYELLVHSAASIASDMGHFINITDPDLFNAEVLSELEPFNPILG